MRRVTAENPMVSKVEGLYAIKCTISVDNEIIIVAIYISPDQNITYLI